MEKQPLRTIVVDDEPLARQLLTSMLKSYSEFSVVATCSDGLEAVQAIRDYKPNVVFLDIQMPECDGFQVLDQLDEEQVPLIIFVTAYDQYAIRAFEVHALDYLLKPFDEERLERSVARILQQQHANGHPKEALHRMLTLLEKMNEKPDYLERLVIKEKHRTFFQPIEDVDWFEADRKYIRIHVGEDTHRIRQGFSQLEGRLDPKRFMRISRSAIINLDRISELRPWFGGDYSILLSSGKRLHSTRTYRENIHAMLGQHQ